MYKQFNLQQYSKVNLSIDIRKKRLTNDKLLKKIVII